MFNNFYQRPKRLKRGETIGIVSPAHYVSKSSFLESVRAIEEMGFVVKYEKSIFYKHWCLAGKAPVRAAQINKMFADTSIKAIFCAQAGYGSMRVIPFLDRKVIRRNPKIFMGYSDITVLLGYFMKQCGLAVFHGPIVQGEITKKMNRLTLNFMLRSLMQARPLGKVMFPQIRVLKPGKAKGTLVGGNISMLANTISTPCEVNTDNAILFLEDIDEDMETIDGHLMQLKLANKFKEVKGILFGRLIGCYDTSGKKYSLRNILHDIFYDIDIPIFYGFPSGHSIYGGKREANITIPLGVQVTIDSKSLSVFFHSAGVQ